MKQDQTLLWTCVDGAHLQCVNIHYAKFEYKLQITHKLHNVSTPTVGVDVLIKFNTPQNIIKCEQKIDCTCSMCELLYVICYYMLRTKFE